MNRKTRAREKANELLTTLGIRRPPVPVDVIASRRGIRVRFVRLDSELSGMIFFQSVPTIAINSLHHPNRQRFTLAHEIGHYELHWNEIGGEVHVDKKLL